MPRSKLTTDRLQPAAARASPAILLLSGAADPTLSHQLTGVLHGLYVVAVVLAALLFVSLLVAVWAFRRNRDTEPKA